MEKTFSKRSLVIITLVSILLTASSTLMVTSYVHSQAISNPGTTYGPGDTDAYSYVCYKEGSNYYYKNGTTRTISSPSTNASYIINYALSHLPSEGGTVILRSGTYSTDTPLTIQSNTTRLMGEDKTVISYSGSDKAISIGIDVASGSETFDIEVSNLWTELGTNGVGIYIVNSFRWSIHRVTVKGPDSGSQTTGIKIDGGQNWCGQGQIYQPDLQYNKVCINITGVTSNIQIFGGRLKSQSSGYSGSYGLWGQGGTSAGGDTLCLYGVSFSQVETGIHLEASPNSLWDSRFITCRFESVTTGMSIETDHNYVYGASFEGSIPTKVTVSGSGNKFYECYNYPTVSYGWQTCASGELVSHGLAGTPNYVLLTCGTSTYGAVAVVVSTYQTAVNSTHFPVYIRWVNGTEVTDDVIRVYWYAEYQP